MFYLWCCPTNQCLLENLLPNVFIFSHVTVSCNGVSCDSVLFFVFSVVSALNKAWCVNCFACSTCNTKLTLK